MSRKQSVYTGTALNSLTPVASNDNVGGDGDDAFLSVVSFAPVTGTTYSIAVAVKTALKEPYDEIQLHWVQPTNPVFTEHPTPSPVNILAGKTLVLESQAIGIPSPTYQWYKDATNLIANATNSTLTISNLVMTSQGAYSVRATCGSASTNSNPSKVWLYDSAAATFSLLTYVSNYLNVHVSGYTNHSFDIDVTTNFLTWTSLETNRNTSFDFTNLVDIDIPSEFFRATQHGQ